MTKAEEINKNMTLIAHRAKVLAIQPEETIDNNAAIRSAYRSDIAYIQECAIRALNLLNSY